MRAGDYARDSESGIFVPRRRGVLHARPQWMGGPAFFGGVGGGNIRINMQFEGPNGSTTFTDTGTGGSTWTVGVNGGATIDTTSPLAGSSSLNFTDAVRYLQSSVYGPMNRIPPTGDWDLQFMVNGTSWSTTQTQYLVSVQDASASAAGTAFAIATIFSTGLVVLLLVLSDGTTRSVPIIGHTGLIVAATYTVLVSRRGNTVALYLNGVSQGSATYTAAINTPSGQTWRIGQPVDSAPAGFGGEFDAFTLVTY